MEKAEDSDEEGKKIGVLFLGVFWILSLFFGVFGFFVFTIQSSSR